MPAQPVQEAPLPTPKPPRRARFQIHLSTAIVLMFVAGGLIWANTTARKAAIRTLRADNWEYVVLMYGWPYEAFDIYRDEIDGKSYNSDFTSRFLRVACAINLAVALVILFATWFICEWLIRRRSARKGA